MSPRLQRFALTSALLAAFACAQAPDASRRGAGSAQSAPGWVEFSLQDRNIPADPLASAASGPRPPTCDLEILLDRESVVALELRPRGDAPPYTLDTSFTIRVYPGEYAAVVHYSSCRNHEQRPDSLEVAAALKVMPGQVTRAHFDGSTLTTQWPEPPAAESPASPGGNAGR